VLVTRLFVRPPERRSMAFKRSGVRLPYAPPNENPLIRAGFSFGVFCIRTRGSIDLQSTSMEVSHLRCPAGTNKQMGNGSSPAYPCIPPFTGGLLSGSVIADLNQRFHGCALHIHGGCLSAAPSGTEAECALWAKQRGEASETERSGTRLFRFPDRSTADGQRFE